jgi:hypothetical protein
MTTAERNLLLTLAELLAEDPDLSLYQRALLEGAHDAVVDEQSALRKA